MRSAFQFLRRRVPLGLVVTAAAGWRTYNLKAAGDDDYAKALKGYAPVQASAPLVAEDSVVIDASAPLYSLQNRHIARENLLAIQAAVASSDDTKSASTHSTTVPTDDNQARYLLRQLRPAAPVFVSSGSDAEHLTSEVSVVAITRGCAPSIASGIQAAVASAAAADMHGFSWYIINDSTPDDVTEVLVKRLNVEIPPRYVDPAKAAKARKARTAASSSADDDSDEPVMPLVAVFDRYSSAQAREKYFMPLPQGDSNAFAPAAGSVVAVEKATAGDKGPSSLSGSGGYAYKPSAGGAAGSSATAAGGSGAASDISTAVSLGLHPEAGDQAAYRLLHEALVPSPAHISAWLNGIASGSVEPTLLGDARPAGDAHPVFPFLAVVVSDSWRDIVLDPRKDVCLEAYMTDCPMCMALGARVRMAGYLADQYFPHVKVAVMNIDDNDRPKQWMPGPAFPTIQMFNAGRKSPSTGKLTSPLTKAFGPGCAHLTTSSAHAGADSDARKAAGSQAEDVRRRVVGTADSGSPPCVPSLDFSHPDPSKAGRMAMPTVTELVDWIARHSSKPFSIDTLMVPADELREQYASNGSDSDADAASDAGPSSATSAAASAAGGGASGSGVVPLSRLTDDMEVEARMLESAIFNMFWCQSVLDQYTKSFHATHPQRRVHMRELMKRLDAAKKIIVDMGFYGTVEQAHKVLDAIEGYMDAHHMVRDVRAHLEDEKNSAAEREAIKVVKQLLR